MPNLTIAHEAPLELIRQHPALAVDLLRALTGLSVSDQAEIRLGPSSLSAVLPGEPAADTVVIVSDPATGAPEVVIVVEPHGRDEQTRRYAWPAYLASVRSTVPCPAAVLIVICPDPDEADECREAIAVGNPGWILRPIVIDPRHAPDDSAGPYLTLFLACLSALDMADGAVARHVLNAIRRTGASGADRVKLTAIVMKSASDAARPVLEDLMSSAEWKDDFIEGFVSQGVAKGKTEEAISVRIGFLMKVLGARDLRPTKKQLSRLAECTDTATLDRWLERSITAASAKEVFAD